VSSDRPYGAPTGTFGSGDFMINLWYLLGWLVDLGGVANLKTVPYIAGDMLSVLEIKLHHRSLLCSVTVGPNRLVHFP
jgi:hypothetical protein